MKLYVWTGVLCDYTNGIAFAVAEDIDTARWAIAKSMDYTIEEFERTHTEFYTQKPSVHNLTKPIGYHCYGGG